MTVNPSTMRLGIASILIGLVGAYGVRVMMEEEEAPPEEVKIKKFLVPLAGQDLPIGRVVRKGDISMREMDADTMKREGMPLELVMMSPEQIIGRRLRKPLRLGEAFLTNSLWLDGDDPGYDLKPGYRAVAVTLPMHRAGYAEVDDVVDVYFTSTPKTADPRKGQRAIPEMTISVADAVTILQVTPPEPGSQSRYQKNDPTFLLQVLPDLVPKFQALHGHGEFSFLIRPENDVSIAKGSGTGTTLEDILGLEEEEPPPQQPIWVTEYFRRGGRSAQHFPIPMPSPEQLAEMKRLYEEQQARLAADAGSQDVEPSDDLRAPPPARRRPTPTLREPDTRGGTPQIPYRGGEPAPRQPLPRSSSAPLPRSSSSALGSNNDAANNPFADDDAGVVLP